MRLSGSSVLSTLDVSNSVDDNAPPTDLLHHQSEPRDSFPAIQEDKTVGADENAISLGEIPQDMPTEHRHSTASTISVQDGERIASTISTVRSRSDSSGTFSSTESAQVDWDELEKSEEQAPRDEGSDEVRLRTH